MMHCTKKYGFINSESIQYKGREKDFEKYLQNSTSQLHRLYSESCCTYQQEQSYYTGDILRLRQNLQHAVIEIIKVTSDKFCCLK